MDTEKVVVERDNISPLAAKIVKTYFVDKCNDDTQAHSTFVGAYSSYDEDCHHMVVEAQLSGTTSAEMGSRAVERAFQFAEQMLAS